MDLNDGQKSIEMQSKDQREHSFKEPPTLLEVRRRGMGRMEAGVDACHTTEEGWMAVVGNGKTRVRVHGRNMHWRFDTFPVT